jgi:FkbM family methyltransferase
MLEYLNFRNGFYIEAGCNNGIDQSNTLHLEKELGWSGILVEPNFYRYTECLKNRSTTNIIEHGALVSADYTEPTICGNFVENSVGDSLSGQITKDAEYCSCIESINALLEKRQRVNIEVPAFTLQSILDKHNISHIDYLSLDVEDYEIQVLKGLDFAKNPPKFMRIETSTFQFRKDRMHDFLKPYGYKFLGMANENDCFYGHKL